MLENKELDPDQAILMRLYRKKQLQLNKAIEAIKVACVVMTVTHTKDFTKAFKKEGIKKLLTDTEHLQLNFKVENYMRDILKELENA